MNVYNRLQNKLFKADKLRLFAELSGNMRKESCEHFEKDLKLALVSAECTKSFPWNGLTTSTLESWTSIPASMKTLKAYKEGRKIVKNEFLDSQVSHTLIIFSFNFYDARSHIAQLFVPEVVKAKLAFQNSNDTGMIN